MQRETELVQEAKRGSAEAFAELYRGVYKDLYRFALYTLKNAQDAEDVVSETVMDAWAQIGDLRSAEAFRGWMFRILSNKCRRRTKEYLEKTQEITEDLCAEQRDLERRIDVQTAFGRLDVQERMILALHIFGGYTSGEIAQMLEMNSSTVRSRQKRALEKMEAYLR